MRDIYILASFRNGQLFQKIFPDLIPCLEYVKEVSGSNDTLEVINRGLCGDNVYIFENCHFQLKMI